MVLNFNAIPLFIPLLALKIKWIYVLVLFVSLILIKQTADILLLLLKCVHSVLKMFQSINLVLTQNNNNVIDYFYFQSLNDIYWRTQFDE